MHSAAAPAATRVVIIRIVRLLLSKLLLKMFHMQSALYSCSLLSICCQAAYQDSFQAVMWLVPLLDPSNCLKRRAPLYTLHQANQLSQLRPGVATR